MIVQLFPPGDMSDANTHSTRHRDARGDTRGEAKMTRSRHLGLLGALAAILSGTTERVSVGGGHAPRGTTRGAEKASRSPVQVQRLIERAEAKRARKRAEARERSGLRLDDE
jgi:hypothetical protein